MNSRKKGCTKEPDARTKLLFCQSNHIAFFAVLVAVDVHISLQRLSAGRCRLAVYFLDIGHLEKSFPESIM